MRIRPATPADANQICAIWNPIIRDTLITFTTIEKTSKEIEQAITNQIAADRPYLVATNSGAILGFATYSPFRSGPGYAYTMEHSINLAPTARDRGIGRALLQDLEKQAIISGVHSLIAGVSSANIAAIAFHTACGFALVGTLPQAGRKFDQWLDLVLLQKLL